MGKTRLKNVLICGKVGQSLRKQGDMQKWWEYRRGGGGGEGTKLKDQREKAGMGRGGERVIVTWEKNNICEL